MPDLGTCDTASRVLLGLSALLFLLGLAFCVGSAGYLIAVARSARLTLRALASLRASVGVRDR